MALRDSQHVTPTGHSLCMKNGCKGCATHRGMVSDIEFELCEHHTREGMYARIAFESIEGKS